MCARVHSGLILVLAISLLWFAPDCAFTQEVPANAEVDAGRLATIRSTDLSLEVNPSSGIIAGLHPLSESSFDYTPSDLLAQRSGDTFYHLGDLDLRVRRRKAGEWTPMSTAFRRKPVRILSNTAMDYTADLSASLPTASGLRLIRSWHVAGDEIELSYDLTNVRSSAVEIGGLGISIVLNNMLGRRSLKQAHAVCSLDDPYIGGQAGYVQDVPLKGVGPVLLIVPLDASGLEAWKPIMDATESGTHLGKIENDPTPRSATFEGSFDWTIHSAAFANDWGSAKQWNPPTSEWLGPGKTRHFGLRLFTAAGVKNIEASLTLHGRPVAVGIPGYVLPQDLEGRLFLRYSSAVNAIVAEPAGALRWHDDGVLASGMHAYTVGGVKWGRSRLRITYADGLEQPIDYFTTKPAEEAVRDMGVFLTHKQWFTDMSDPFGRAPSILSYDNQSHDFVLEDHRAWVAGLSDEAGAGPYLATAMKEFLQPNKEEIERLEAFVDGVLWGHLQPTDGIHAFGVRKSLFYYDPAQKPGFAYDAKVKQDHTWNRKEADRLDRTYNYPHVVATYWSLYRIARNTTGLVTHHPADWYLNQAYQTTMAMQREAALFDRFGLMEGTVFVSLLDDLRAEGKQDEADKLEAYMRIRAKRWASEVYPFGSEKPWDSTGQEEVYAWSKRFGMQDKADISLNAILAYTPTLPNWGYNGAARRYWDFTTAGKIERIERMLHHYGSGLNAIPLLASFREHPDDLYLLRTGYGGTMGPLTNIDEQGFASVAFHAFPDTMDFDPFSGDYGSNFFGHAFDTGTYLVHDPEMGWLCFGGNLKANATSVHVDVLDSARRSIFVASLGLFLTLDAGQVVSFDYDFKKKTVRVQFVATAAEPALRFRLQSTASPTRRFAAGQLSPSENGRYEVPLMGGESSYEVLIQ